MRDFTSILWSFNKCKCKTVISRVKWEIHLRNNFCAYLYFTMFINQLTNKLGEKKNIFKCFYYCYRKLQHNAGLIDSVWQWLLIIFCAMYLQSWSAEWKWGIIVHVDVSCFTLSEKKWFQGWVTCSGANSSF